MENAYKKLAESAMVPIYKSVMTPAYVISHADRRKVCFIKLLRSGAF